MSLDPDKELKAASRHAEILENWKGCKKLYLIDIWDSYNDYHEKWSENNITQKTNYLNCLENVKEYKNKYEIIKDFSKNSSKLFLEESIDFIYIDANHSYEYVKEDLNLWYPKLKKGGLFAGDDYTLKDIDYIFDSNFGVKKAVDEFCFKNKKNASIDINGDWFYKMNNNNLLPSRNWYFIK